MAERIAGTEPAILQILAAMSSAPKQNRRQTVAPGESWVERNRAIPGNVYIFPDQQTEMKSDRGGWAYPLFRQDLVDAGLLPQQAPSGGQHDIALPPGMTVLEAIQAGLIR